MQVLSYCGRNRSFTFSISPMQEIVASLLAALGTRAISDLRELLTYGLDAEAPPPNVSIAAQRMGVPRRTLASHLQRTGLPSPGRILQWCIVLRACDRLSGTRDSVERITENLGLSKPYTLRRLLKRYLRCTPSQLRGPEHGREAIDGFLAALTVGRGSSSQLEVHE